MSHETVILSDRTNYSTHSKLTDVQGASVNEEKRKSEFPFSVPSSTTTCISETDEADYETSSEGLPRSAQENMKKQIYQKIRSSGRSREDDPSSDQRKSGEIKSSREKLETYRESHRLKSIDETQERSSHDPDSSKEFQEFASAGRHNLLMRSESLPIFKTASNDSTKSNDSNRVEVALASESSSACVKKMKMIVALMSESNDGSVNDDSKTDLPNQEAKKLESKTELPILQSSENETSYRRKELTFFDTENDHETLRKGSNSGQSSTRKSISDTGTNENPYMVDDLIDIAENPYPSIKSFYIPPNPQESRSQNRSFEQSRRQSRVFNDLNALLRIDGELGPLRHQLSEIIGKYRALNVARSLDHQNHPGHLTLSPSSSCYFLRRAETFGYNSPSNEFVRGGLVGKFHSQDPTLTIVGKSNDCERESNDFNTFRDSRGYRVKKDDTFGGNRGFWGQRNMTDSGYCSQKKKNLSFILDIKSGPKPNISNADHFLNDWKRNNQSCFLESISNRYLDPNRNSCASLRILDSRDSSASDNSRVIRNDLCRRNFRSLTERSFDRNPSSSTFSKDLNVSVSRMNNLQNNSVVKESGVGQFNQQDSFPVNGKLNRRLEMVTHFRGSNVKRIESISSNTTFRNVYECTADPSQDSFKTRKTLSIGNSLLSDPVKSLNPTTNEKGVQWIPRTRSRASCTSDVGISQQVHNTGDTKISGIVEKQYSHRAVSPIQELLFEKTGNSIAPSTIQNNFLFPLVQEEEEEDKQRTETSGNQKLNLRQNFSTLSSRTEFPDEKTSSSDYHEDNEDKAREEKVIIVPIVFINGVPEPPKGPIFNFAKTARDDVNHVYHICPNYPNCPNHRIVAIEKNQPMITASGCSDNFRTASLSRTRMLESNCLNSHSDNTEPKTDSSKLSTTYVSRSSSSMKCLKNLSSTSSVHGSSKVRMKSATKIVKDKHQNLSGERHRYTESMKPRRTVRKEIRGMISSPDDFLCDT